MGGSIDVDYFGESHLDSIVFTINSFIGVALSSTSYGAYEMAK
jgi:hypothetical protein